MDRYYVDQRIGCIAVRDQTLDDPEYKCLEPDGIGVIKYWHGEFVDGEVCETCHRSFGKVWRVKSEDIVAANELCNELNKEIAA